MSYYTNQQSRMQSAFQYTTTLCAIDCACGKVHFTSAPGHGDYDAGELERLQALAVNEPDKYLECSDFDSIDAIYIDGQQLVVDCPCGRAEKYAKWIERHARGLASYLIAYLDQQAQDAARKSREANRLEIGLRKAASEAIGGIPEPSPRHKPPARKLDLP